MSLLAPLYIAGALAIALPIVFHLIRRAPHGRQDFSSLMFLTASPPRLTRRSRLNNIVLLLLRAAALALLAFAFARPFLNRGADTTAGQAPGRRIALLIDTSASMRRADLWQQATRHAEQAIHDLSPRDEVALLLFDRQVRPALTFAEWNELDPSRRAAVLRGRLAEAKPTWAATKLGDALATAADMLTEDESKAAVAGAVRQLVLISDMQQGGHIEALQGHQWPQGVLLEVKPVATKQPANAGIQLVKDPAEAPEGGDAAPKLRVRVSNQADSNREQFTLAWADERGPLAGLEPLKVYVPPGRSQTARVALPPAGRQADRIILSGDDSDFDNTLYVVPPRKESLRVLFIGEDAPDDVNGLSYFLRSALGDTPRRKVEFVAKRPADPLSQADVLGSRLVVVAAAVPEDRVAFLRRFAEAGGDVLWVMKDVAAAQGLARVMGVESLPVEEAPLPPGDYALIGRVQSDHPLFLPFAESRFGDFTKIHFWKHRRVKLPESAGARVLAWFDKGDPFLFERTLEKGRVLVATSGWHPSDSQLALSTKFVPLMDGLLRPSGGAAAADVQYAVHDPIALPPADAAQGSRTLTAPDGRKIDLAPGATAFDGTDRPGIYQLSGGGQETPLAVNLPPDESRTAPVPVEDLERWGAKLGTRKPSEELVTAERRLRYMELENRQKLWRWLIVAVLGILAVETALAGLLARRGAREQVTA